MVLERLLSIFDKKCKFYGKCKFADPESPTCTKMDGDYYGVGRKGGCYRDLAGLIVVLAVLVLIMVPPSIAGRDCPYTKGGKHAVYTTGIVVSDGFEDIKENAIWKWNGTEMVKYLMPDSLHQTIIKVRAGLLNLWEVL